MELRLRWDPAISEIRASYDDEFRRAYSEALTLYGSVTVEMGEPRREGDYYVTPLRLVPGAVPSGRAGQAALDREP